MCAPIIASIRRICLRFATGIPRLKRGLEGKTVQRSPQVKLSMSGFAAATVLGLIAAFVTAAAASWSGIGNSLWAIAVPALLVGLSAFVVALWRMHAGDSAAQIWHSVKELWNEFGKLSGRGHR
jgi:hypothetical protein